MHIIYYKTCIILEICTILCKQCKFKKVFILTKQRHFTSTKKQLLTIILLMTTPYPPRKSLILSSNARRTKANNTPQYFLLRKRPTQPSHRSIPLLYQKHAHLVFYRAQKSILHRRHTSTNYAKSRYFNSIVITHRKRQNPDQD